MMYKRSLAIAFAGLFLVTVMPLVSGNKESTICLSLSFTLDQKIYDYSDYGEPPQIAIWLEQPESGTIKTLFVTRRTALGDWHGKTECPVSLPYWVGRFNKETGQKGFPGRNVQVADGVSGATPRKKFSLKFHLPRGNEWDIYIEMNVAGDYNRHFPSMLDDGMPDSQANGQPSLVYRGRIKAMADKKDITQLIGRTLQLDPTHTLIKDLSGITDAKKVLDNITIKFCH